jgi:hypothetical protein
VWDPGVQGLDEEMILPNAANDEDEDSAEDLVPAVGSSIYRLGANPSNQLAKPSRGSGHRSKRDTNAKSIYILNAHGTSEHGATPGKSASNRKLHRDGQHASSMGKSTYRLKDVSADTGGGRRSPASRDGSTGMLRVGDLGNLFRRRGKERDDGWRG